MTLLDKSFRKRKISNREVYDARKKVIQTAANPGQNVSGPTLTRNVKNLNRNIFITEML